MDDDFNTPRAIAATFDYIRQATPVLEKGGVGAGELDHSRETFKTFTADILGLKAETNTLENSDNHFEEIMQLILQLRDRMRKEKNWETADFIRDELARQGIVIKDTPRGTVWEYK